MSNPRIYQVQNLENRITIANDQANSAFEQANAASLQANTSGGNAADAFNKANSAANTTAVDFRKISLRLSLTFFILDSSTHVSNILYRAIV